jgi:AraC-like DNA-binding protein
MTEVALSAGFGSVRRFNEIFRNMFGRPPSALRRKGSGPAHAAGDAVTLRLSYRPPYDWPGMLEALALRASRRFEWIERGVWHRRIELDGKAGHVAVAHLPERNAVAVTIAFPDVRALPTIVARVKRVFDLGASPIAGAQTRRVLFAKHLIHDTQLPMTEVALSAGFGSVRRFNEIFLKMFGRPPSALRRARRPDTSARDGVTLRLSYRPPYDWPGILEALAQRDRKKVEWIEGGVWHRRIELDGKTGTVAVSHLAERNSVAVTIRFPEVRALPAIVARVKRVFDLGADIATIGSHLAQDPRLAPLIAKRPGLRAPGEWDRETVATIDANVPPAWRPWHAYAAQHLRMANHG